MAKLSPLRKTAILELPANVLKQKDIQNEVILIAQQFTLLTKMFQNQLKNALIFLKIHGFKENKKNHQV